MTAPESSCHPHLTRSIMLFRRATARAELSAIRGISLEPIPSGADIDYAILRSARGDGTEAIALTATWTLPDGRGTAFITALSLLIPPYRECRWCRTCHSARQMSFSAKLYGKGHPFPDLCRSR